MNPIDFYGLTASEVLLGYSVETTEFYRRYRPPAAQLHQRSIANEPGAKASTAKKPARANRKAAKGSLEVDMGERVTS
jgi:hypothetical protein